MPFRRSVSGGEKVGEQAAVVWVLRSAWERVMLREEFVGRFRVELRFPQYLDMIVKVVDLKRARLEGMLYT